MLSLYFLAAILMSTYVATTKGIESDSKSGYFIVMALLTVLVCALGIM